MLDYKTRLPILFVKDMACSSLTIHEARKRSVQERASPWTALPHAYPGA